MLHGRDHLRVEAQVFRGAATGNDQRVVVLDPDVVEAGIECEVVTRLFRVGLVTLEVVDRGAYLLPGLFARADGVYRMADHQ